MFLFFLKKTCFHKFRALYSKCPQELRLTNLDAVMRRKIKRNLREANHVESLRKSFENSTQPEEELYARFKTEYQALDSRLAGLVTEKKMLDAEKKIVLQVMLLLVFSPPQSSRIFFYSELGNEIACKWSCLKISQWWDPIFNDLLVVPDGCG